MADFSGLNPTLTYITAYLLTAIGSKVFFFLVRRMTGEKLVSKAVFGNFEYYLGMGAGVARFACILLFGLALLNAKQYTKAEIKAKLEHQQDWAGSIYFPPFGVVQQTIFEESLTGRAVKQFLSAQLNHRTFQRQRGALGGRHLKIRDQPRPIPIVGNVQCPLRG